VFFVPARTGWSRSCNPVLRWSYKLQIALQSILGPSLEVIARFGIEDKQMLQFGVQRAQKVHVVKGK
jgi:hypothetical protein